MKKEKMIIAICLTIISLIGAGLLYSIKAAPVLVAAFVSLGMATIIYYFLGGMKDASFAKTGLRVGGASAVIIFLMIFVSKGLEKYIPTSLSNIENLFDRSTNEWIPIGSDGKPFELTIKGIKIDNSLNTIKVKPSFLQFNELAAAINNDRVQIFPKSALTFCFGTVPKSDLRGLGFFSSILDERSVLFETTALTAGTTNAVLRNQFLGQDLPIKLSTTVYASDLSGFRIMGADNREIANGQLGTREGKIFRFENDFYLIFVLDANHMSSNPNGIYTKFAAYKFSVN
jgi:hypothetical protein